MRVAIGCDHAAVTMKNELMKRLIDSGVELLDCGCPDETPVDYPVIAKQTAEKVLEENLDFGLLICGTGLGMSIAANKVPGIRAAACSDVFSARMARAHNDANIITMGARTLGIELAWEILQAYISEHFLEGVHKVRVNQIIGMERKSYE